jgi:hypothetical protein
MVFTKDFPLPFKWSKTTIHRGDISFPTSAMSFASLARRAYFHPYAMTLRIAINKVGLAWITSFSVLNSPLPALA